MFWEIYFHLCSEKGESPNSVAKKLSIASGTVTEWKRGRVPRPGTLKKIADYFGVSVNELLGQPKTDETSTDHASIGMSEFLTLFQQFTEEQQAMLIAAMKGALSVQKAPRDDR